MKSISSEWYYLITVVVFIKIKNLSNTVKKKKKKAFKCLAFQSLHEVICSASPLHSEVKEQNQGEAEYKACPGWHSSSSAWRDVWIRLGRKLPGRIWRDKLNLEEKKGNKKKKPTKKHPTLPNLSTWVKRDPSKPVAILAPLLRTELSILGTMPERLLWDDFFYSRCDQQAEPQTQRFGFSDFDRPIQKETQRSPRQRQKRVLGELLHTGDIGEDNSLQIPNPSISVCTANRSIYK